METKNNNSGWQEKFLDELFYIYPELGTASGYHEYNNLLSLRGKEYIEEERAFLEKWSKFFRSPSQDFRNVYECLAWETAKKFVQYRMWINEVFQPYVRDPSVFNPFDAFNQLYLADWLSEQEKKECLKERVKALPLYYQTAISLIKRPVIGFINLARVQLQHGIYFLSKVIAPYIEDEKSVNEAIDAIKRFLGEVGMLPYEKEYFMGHKTYSEKFRLEIDEEVTCDDNYHSAYEEARAVTAEMVKVARELWRKHFKTSPPSSPDRCIKEVTEYLSRLQMVSPAAFMKAIHSSLIPIFSFVKEKKMFGKFDEYFSIPPEEGPFPLIIREMPLYMRGVAGISVSPLPYFSKRGTTYYNVEVPESLPRRHQEDFLKEYNGYVIDILNFHEAMPGHYLQAVYSKHCPSPVLGVLQNTAFVEGWAVYAETLMADNDFLTEEHLLFYYKWRLRVIYNTIIDYGIHCEKWNKEKVISILEQEAFQTKGEAAQKYIRATLTSVQLSSYMAGYKLLQLIRRIARRRGMNLQEFHDFILSFGAPMPSLLLRYLKEEICSCDSQKKDS